MEIITELTEKLKGEETAGYMVDILEDLEFYLHQVGCILSSVIKCKSQVGVG